ncbi:immunoglobulin-like domain-containing protein [Halalkalibacter oceani]|uniref:immunoglobulin-like domain-containing protein n=1 Tax=Halalkalibacter oceani TaxID=1653776 RepID=UPI0033966244
MSRVDFSLFYLALSLLLFSGCGSDNRETADWERSQIETVNSIDGVTMKAKEGTLSSTGLTVTFENSTDKQMIYGEYFLLEKNINGSWYEVPVSIGDNYGFDAIGYRLDSTTVLDWPVDWEWLYGSLDSGHYRIIKNILDFRQPGDYDKYDLAAEFTIE